MNPISTEKLDYSHADAVMLEIIDFVKSYNHSQTKEEIHDTLWGTYIFARDAHEGQMRKSWEPYINHPVEAAKILTSIKPDLVTIQACLLHDVPEDTAVTAEMIREVYGNEVANITAGMEKLANPKLRYQWEERTIGSLRKMFFCMVDDIRIIFVKLADRLHNMRTLSHHPDPKKREKIALETLNIYAPIADRLGLFDLKSELETECFKTLHPVEAHQIIEELDELKESQDIFIAQVESMIREIIWAHIPIYSISYRVKSPYSIFKKLDRKDIGHVRDLYDLFAVRIITDNVRHCYEILGDLHSKWKPLPKRFKDYIALPKENGYQSLHTTVVWLISSNRTQPTEIQIRTREMHEHAEIWVAAHFEYSEKGGSVIANDVVWVREIKNILERWEDNTAFFNEMKTQVFDDQIFVFTPKGKVITLPRWASAIDFAYHIHSDVGNHLAFVHINGRNAPIDQPLVNGDVLEIITDSKRQASINWLSLVKTSRARDALKSFLASQNRDELIEKGRMMLASYLEQTFGMILDKDNNLLRVLDGHELTARDKEEIFVQIGNRSRKPSSVVRGIDFLRDMQRSRHAEKSPSNKPNNSVVEEFHPWDTELVIGGEKHIEYHLAACCTPSPGDRIAGYVSHHGVSIHKYNCDELQKCSIERFIEAHWSGQGPKKIELFQVDLELTPPKSSPIKILEHVESLWLTIESFEQQRSGQYYIVSMKLSSYIDDYFLRDRLVARLENIAWVRVIQQKV